MRVGVLGDTHGLLRPEALRALAGVAHILHAGDVGGGRSGAGAGGELLARLRALAPVTVVRGNVDPAAGFELPGGERLRPPLREMLELAGVTVYLHHGHEPLDLDPVAAGVGVVVQGHSHRPALEWRRGVLYLNPGSAGPRRFQLPVALAVLHLEDGAARAEHILLESSSG